MRHTKLLFHPQSNHLDIILKLTPEQSQVMYEQDFILRTHQSLGKTKRNINSGDPLKHTQLSNH